jgi:hypothetical protein
VAEPAQQIGAGGVVGVIAGQLVLKAVDGRRCHLQAVKLGDRDGPVEGDDQRGVEADELVAGATTCDQSVSRTARAEVCTALIAARIW